MDRIIEEKCDEVQKYRFSEPQRAYDICLEILHHGIENEDNYEIAYARMYMGDTMLSLGRLKEAVDNMLIAEKLLKQHGFDKLLVNCYNITAVIYSCQGDELLALDKYYEAMEVAKRQDDKRMLGILYNNIGAVLHKFGDAEAAVRFYEKGYELCIAWEKEQGDTYFNAKQFCINICKKYIVRKEYKKAAEYLEQALKEVKETMLNPVTEISLLGTYLEIYIGLGDKTQTERLIVRLFSFPEEYFAEGECYEDLNGISQMLVHTGYLEEARKLLEILDRECEKNAVSKRGLRQCEGWMEYYKAVGETKVQRELYRKYFRLKQKLKEEKNAGVVAAIDNRYKLEYERMINEQLSANTRELLKKSEIDELTGIGNRYSLKKRFTKICEMAVFENQNVCMCLFDIDNFKIYNDEYGHLCGDECLKVIAYTLQETVGKDYFASRYGGDEFVVLGINKSDKEVEQFAKKLFGSIKNARVLTENRECPQHVTISMGIVNEPVKSGTELEEFIHKSDERLYLAKKKGKSCYVFRTVTNGDDQSHENTGKISEHEHGF